MITEQDVRHALHRALDPSIEKPLDDLGAVEAVETDRDRVRVSIRVPIPGDDENVRRSVEEALAGLGAHLEVRVSEMSPEQRAEMVGRLRGGKTREETVFFSEGPTEVVAVASGKGGVGKSSVTANLAASLAAEGQRVGILDADVWGFSIPRMMGVSGQPAGTSDMIVPPRAHGVKIISMGFFVSDETPVIWRGPMLHKAIQQFLGDVYWGELDALFVDLPPGTGDVSISLASFLPRGAMLVVTTPQEAAAKVAERAGRMAQHPNIDLEVLGVVENMAGFVCPHCGEITPLFGEGGGARTAEALDVPLLGSVPIQVSLREGSDEGTPVVVSEPDSPAGAAFREIAGELGTRIRSPRGKPLSLRET
ncbi:MAG TPA: Mrp/NBP35 family ATP-binding protein [Actinomycetota bacterium]